MRKWNQSIGKKILAGVLSVAMITSMASSVAYAAEGDTNEYKMSIYATADASTATWDSEKAQNHGGSKVIFVHNLVEPNYNNLVEVPLDMKLMFMKFDLNDIRENQLSDVTKYELVLTYDSKSGGDKTTPPEPVDEIGLFETVTSDWIEGTGSGAVVTSTGEDGINYESRPMLVDVNADNQITRDDAVAITTIEPAAASSGTEYVWDITDCVTAALADENKQILSLMGGCLTGNSNQDIQYRVNFRSREYGGTSVPRIDVTYRANEEQENLILINRDVLLVDEYMTANKKVSRSIALPADEENGSTITWVSKSTSISNDGVVLQRPTDEDEEAVLEATLQRNGSSVTKEYTIIIKSEKSDYIIEETYNVTAEADTTLWTWKTEKEIINGTISKMDVQEYIRPEYNTLDWDTSNTEDMKVAYLRFQIKDLSYLDEITGAKVKLYFESVTSKTVNDSNKFVSLGFFEASNDWDESTMNFLNRAAVVDQNNDGSITSEDAIGIAEFDVSGLAKNDCIEVDMTDAIKNMVANSQEQLTVCVGEIGDGSVALPRIYFYTKDSSDAAYYPTLEVAYQVIDEDYITDSQAEANIANVKSEIDAYMAANGSSLTGNLSLPVGDGRYTFVTWESSNTSVITSKGNVSRPSTDTTVTLTAKIKSGEVEKTYEYIVVVQAKSASTSTGTSFGGGGFGFIDPIDDDVNSDGQNSVDDNHGNDSDGTVITEPEEKIPAVASKYTLKKKQKKQIKVRNVDAGTKIKYISKNKKVVYVSKKGVIKGKKSGQTKIVTKITVDENTTYRFVTVVKVK